jgi:hypothetical protein
METIAAQAPSSTGTTPLESNFKHHLGQSYNCTYRVFPHPPHRVSVNLYLCDTN